MLTVCFPKLAPSTWHGGVSEYWRIDANIMRAAIRCPNTGDLIFSPAHRLLAIALRRGYLQQQNGSTVSELLASNKYHIMIKPQYKDQYIFLADPTAQGSPDTTSAPMTVSQLDDFLRAQCSEAGIATQGIKMKCIRRGALIDLESRIGVPTTHTMLDEKPKNWQPKWHGTQHNELLGLWFDWTQLLLTPNASNRGESGHQLDTDSAGSIGSKGKGKKRQAQASNATDRAVHRESRPQAEQKPAELDTVAPIAPEQSNTPSFELQARAFMELLVGDTTLF
jgi:hypothetical protein